MNRIKFYIQHIHFVLYFVKGSSTVMQKKKTGPPHKPMTYVEQLQKINQVAPKTRGKAGKLLFS